jgi:predicted transcriptional regulator
MARKKKDEKLEPLEEIKRLIILGLINQGVKGKDIATMLEVDPAIISRMISPKKK